MPSASEMRRPVSNSSRRRSRELSAAADGVRWGSLLSDLLQSLHIVGLNQPIADGPAAVGRQRCLLVGACPSAQPVGACEVGAQGRDLKVRFVDLEISGVGTECIWGSVGQFQISQAVTQTLPTPGDCLELDDLKIAPSRGQSRSEDRVPDAPRRFFVPMPGIHSRGASILAPPASGNPPGFSPVMERLSSRTRYSRRPLRGWTSLVPGAILVA
jgi:hypothetical protein